MISVDSLTSLPVCVWLGQMSAKGALQIPSTVCFYQIALLPKVSESDSYMSLKSFKNVGYFCLVHIVSNISKLTQTTLFNIPVLPAQMTSSCALSFIKS